MAAQILIVEDHPAIQELIAVNLMRAGYEVHRVGDAEKAAEYLRAGLQT